MVYFVVDDFVSPLLPVYKYFLPSVLFTDRARGGLLWFSLATPVTFIGGESKLLAVVAAGVTIGFCDRCGVGTE